MDAIRRQRVQRWLQQLDAPLPRTYRRFVRYSVVGTSAFVFDLLLLSLFVDVLQLPVVPAAGVAFTIATAGNFLVSRYAVFQYSSRNMSTGFANFLLVAVVGVAFTMGCMYMLTQYTSVHYLVSRVVIAVLVGIFNYLMNLYVNFRVAGYELD
jgi:putative flippase GtrA